MTGRRLAGIVLLAALSANGCHPKPDSGHDLDVGGCATAYARRVLSPAGPVLDVVAHHCLTTTDPTYRVASRIWLHLSDDIRAVRVRTDGADSAPTVISREDLERRYGPILSQGRKNELVWLLLPVGLLACATLMTIAVYGAVRGGVFIVTFRTDR